jgi:hypothetical protein
MESDLARATVLGPNLFQASISAILTNRGRLWAVQDVGKWTDGTVLSLLPNGFDVAHLDC